MTFFYKPFKQLRLGVLRNTFDRNDNLHNLGLIFPREIYATI